jgi:hypothetical protein
MLRLKDRNSLIYSAILVCLIEGCKEEALKLWSTETNIIDVCERHFKILESEVYKS